MGMTLQVNIRTHSVGYCRKCAAGIASTVCLWANGHGHCYRYFCHSCGQYHDVKHLHRWGYGEFLIEQFGYLEHNDRRPHVLRLDISHGTPLNKYDHYSDR